jgi:hypothetical protein
MELGRYCKAYPLSSLRAFPGWSEAAANARPEDPAADAPAPRSLTDDSVVYVHEDLTVTDGVFPGENVLFDGVTPEWEAFCRGSLEFDPQEAGR